MTKNQVHIYYIIWLCSWAVYPSLMTIILTANFKLMPLLAADGSFHGNELSSCDPLDAKAQLFCHEPAFRAWVEFGVWQGVSPSVCGCLQVCIVWVHSVIHILFKTWWSSAVGIHVHVSYFLCIQPTCDPMVILFYGAGRSPTIYFADSLD